MVDVLKFNFSCIAAKHSVVVATTMDAAIVVAPRQYNELGLSRRLHPLRLIFPPQYIPHSRHAPGCPQSD